MQDEASEGTSSLRNRLLLFFKKIRKNRSCMKNIQHITYDEKNRKEITRNMPLKNTKNKPADFKVCFLDTEFNATDYNNQNDGFQEITEIGAVIFQNGRPIDRFTQYCKIKKGHKQKDNRNKTGCFIKRGYPIQPGYEKS